MAFQRKAPHSHHLESILVHLPADLSTFLAGISTVLYCAPLVPTGTSRNQAVPGGTE